jgi:hypothetical protein
LEGALLQGDVSNDLVEAAFFRYLQGLEKIAQLQMVAMCLEEGPANDPEADVLHVIGRTQNLPRQYFYRRYTNHMWTPWEPVTTEIEGDHIAIAVWQGRLNLFWATFLEKGKANTNSNETVDDARFKRMSNAVQKEVEIQLSRSEYFQGQWSTRESSGFDRPIRYTVRNNYSNSDVFHYLIKTVEDGSEILKLYLLYERYIEGQSKAKYFYLVNRHSAAEVKDATESMGPLYYRVPPVGYYNGSGPLSVRFSERMEGNKASTPVRKDILYPSNRYKVLPCSNTPELVADDIAALIAPFFYRDRDHTFFVQPTLKETTLLEWGNWGIQLPAKAIEINEDDWWKQLPVKAKVPGLPQSPLARLNRTQVELDVQQRYGLDTQEDWLTDDATQLEFGEQIIDKNGAVSLVKATPALADHDNDAMQRLPIVVGRSGVSSELVARLNMDKQS